MKKYVVWKVSTKDLNVASFRYRCLMPIRHLPTSLPDTQQLIIENSDFFILNKHVKALIFVKSFTNNDLWLCEEAARLGIPFYLDLCDNFFYRVKNKKFNSLLEEITLTNALKNFSKMAKKAKLIVTTGEELQRIIIDEFPSLQNKTINIPDAIELADDVAFFNTFQKNKNKNKFKLSFTEVLIEDFFNFRLWRKIASLIFWRTKRLLHGKSPWRRLSSSKKMDLTSTNEPDLIQAIRRDSNKKILWFGNGGIPNIYGITDLLLIKKELEEIFIRTPFTLIVCSNNKEIFDDHISPLALKSSFVNWSNWTNSELLDICDLVIIPNPKNEFTIGKSSNRALMALSRGKPVVATETTALKGLSPLIKFENWSANIQELLNKPNSFQKDWENTWPSLLSQFSSSNTAAIWKEILDQ